MLRALGKALLWALVPAALTAVLFEGLSYGFAHGNPLLVAVFLGVAMADRLGLPGGLSPLSVFGYQLAYFALLALIVLAGKGIPSCSAQSDSG
jgi:hypothetical protein